MPLTAGSRLGAYEIRDAIGKGGMGEVYRAHDPRLGRDVALKVLPESMATNEEALARFEREARAERLIEALDKGQPFVYYTGFPGFDPLRADPRFKEALSRLGLSH